MDAQMTTIREGILPSNDASQPWLVMKFGGTSVSSAAQWEIIARLVRDRQTAGYWVVVVHSALAEVSDRLEALLGVVADGEYQTEVDAILDVHLALASDLDLNGEGLLSGYKADLQQLVAGIKPVKEVSPRVYAKVMAFGELMATRLGAAYLESQGFVINSVDARDVLESVVDPHGNERSRYLSASCAFEPEPELQSRLAGVDGIVLTQGFIARNRDGEDVLLGRGGSDTSAAYLAGKLQARGLEIWTDVPGLFSANPRVVSGARLLKALSYEEAQEIVSTGSSVLHPRCIRPVRSYGIPVTVRCTAQPEYDGTLISRDPGSDAPGLKAISSRAETTVISMETVGMWREVGFLARVFACFSEMGLSVDLVSTAESNVTVTLDTRLEPIDDATLAGLRTALQRLCRVQIIKRTEVVSLVGQKIRAILHEIGPALEVFEEHRVHLVSQAANDLNLSFVVEEGQAHRLIQALHAKLVQPAIDDAIFGSTWTELQEQTVPVAAPRKAWWSRKRDELVAIGTVETSAYVYDLDTIREACAHLTGLENIDRVFYAIKANSHPEILRVISAAGLSFECVSPGEVRRVFEVFPEIDRRRILFTPNFAPRGEYEFGIEQGLWITLDNLHPMREWGDIFSGQEIFLRIDSGQGCGHHEHVRTAGVHSKFGVPWSELREAANLARQAGATVVGLHAHTGSGILKADHWHDIARALLEAAAEFPDVRILDLGGGLGVPEKPGQGALDMARLDASIETFRKANPEIELWLEPGRYLVAEAGVLLASVTQTKGKEALRYVGVSTGMNSLIRPALYGAYHEIANLSRLDEPAEELVNVVGPICETGDKLGVDRLLPRCREGDILLVANAGAYGYVMASRYNLRDPAAEFAF